MLFSQCQPFKDCGDIFGGLCRFELILELSIGLRVDLPGRALVIEFEQDDKYFRVEVNCIAFCKDARYAFWTHCSHQLAWKQVLYHQNLGLHAAEAKGHS